jgi:hypothetical protein
MSSPQYPVPDGSEFWTFRVDRKGDELPFHDTTDVYVLPHLKKLVRENNYTDIFIISHGWNCVALPDGSTDFAHDMTRALIANNVPQQPGHKALYIAITWPSHPIKSLFVGTEGVRENYHVHSEVARALLAEDPRKYWTNVQKAIENKHPKAAGKLGEIAEHFDTSSPVAGGQLPDHVLSKVTEFGNYLGAEDALNSSVFSPPKRVFEKVTPLDDPDDLNPETHELTIPMIARAVKATRDVARLIGFGQLVNVADHSIMLSRLLEHVFFETFERRAAVVGANGVSQLIWELMSESADHCTKVHLVGHSLGCHVMSSAAARGSPSAGDPNWVFPRKIHSMSLLQGAVPMTAYAKPGAYRVLTEGYPIVAGPVIATTSRSDLALQTYALFKGKPLGRDGFPDLGAKGSVVDLPAGLTQKLGFQNGRFYTLDADPVISIESLKNGLDVVGAHCDIFDKEIQQCIWEAAHTEMDEKDYVIAVV